MRALLLCDLFQHRERLLDLPASRQVYLAAVLGLAECIDLHAVLVDRGSAVRG